jgi:SdrD B-like domain/Secretion system C-terminal sorting domain
MKLKRNGMKILKEYAGLQFFVIMFLLVLPFCGQTNAQWTHSDLQVGAINSVFTNGNDLLAGFNGNGGSIIITQDNDASWHYAETGIPSGADVRAFGANSSYVFAGTNSGLYRCNNDGNYNWSLVLNEGCWSLIVTDNDIFAGTLGAGLFHSTDNGNTWTSTTSGMELYPDVYALVSNGTYLFAGMYAGNGTANSPNAGVYRSSDNGATWVQKSIGLTNFDVFSLLVKDNYIFAGTNGGVFRSRDIGDNWAYVTGGSVHSLKIVCGSDIYAGLLNQGGVSFSTDNGNTWTSDGLTGYAATSLAVLGTHLYAGTAGTGVYKSDIVCSKSTDSICGMKFNDINGNGIKDPGEPGLPNWIINLSYQNAAGTVTVKDTTDDNGNYFFDNLQPGGTYTVSETNQVGWEQTFPGSTGIYTVNLTSGQHLDTLNFGNHLTTVGSICDSLRATASKTSPGDCNWSLSLQQPSNLMGISSIQILCLSPNQFTIGTGLGTNYQNWYTSANTYIPPSGHVPGGNLNDFFRMNINYVTSPQLVVVNWLDSLSNRLCSDTLKLDCQISCTTLFSDTVTCKENGYNFSYKFTNNATYPISNIQYTLESGSRVTISPLADTLSPELAAGVTSGLQNIQLSGGMPGDTVIILAKFISSGGCCWCFETFNVILPNCKSVCDSLNVHATGSSEDCCYSISLTNNSSTVFSSVELALLSGGMFSTVSTTSAPGWGFTNISPNNLINLIKLPFGYGIGNGTFNDVLDMCIRHYSDSTQIVEVRWIKDGQVVCRDTLRFNCVPTIPPTDTCSQLIDGTFDCLSNGTVQYIFRVQNNSAINSTGFGIFSMTPGVTFSKTIFNNTHILPGQVSPIDTIIISGIGQDRQVCLQTSIFVTVDSIYNYCCHSDTTCLVIPYCNGKDSSEACISWDLLNSEQVTSVNGNINGTPESIGTGSSSPFMSIFLPYSNGQRLWVGNITGWIAGPLDPMRYIEFNVSPNSGNNFTVTNLSFNYGDFPANTNYNTLNFKAYYSIDGWINSTVLNATALIYKNTSMSVFSQALSVLVQNGKTFSMRIYPYALQNSNAAVPSFAIHNNILICGTTSSVASIDEGKTGNVIPKNFQLYQNFPNPFNPSTIIQYDIPKTSFVKLSVYDILGREISVLVDEEKGPGEYNIIFNEKELTSGIYFYVIRAGVFVQIRKMILIK